ncbi:MAG: O-antigen ligase family protein [Actinomycetota bacterium]|nr:O-antigen ligase family protein [Actinomycetota bacterium]
MLERLDRLPAASASTQARLLWLVVGVATVVGVAGWATQTLTGGVIALWSFCLAAAALAFVLPFPLALVSPLYMGILGWLVDMLPLVILCGWAAVVTRWVIVLVTDRRLPRGGRWIWLPIGLLVWTALGVLVITSLDFKHFLLLLAIQVLASGAVLAVVDQVDSLEDRSRIVSGIGGFIVVLSVAVFLQWIGVNLETLQDGEVRRRVEAAYGLDAFPNNIGMIKYARSVKAGSLELRQKLDRVAEGAPDLPAFEVFRPKFQAYENSLVVRFEGSARDHEDALAQAGVRLLYDNVGLAPANTVPRMRSFPRNALTYAGICAALFPLAFFLVWTGRRRIGWAIVVACLFGAGFSLARGAWVAIALGIVYLLVDGLISRRHKGTMVIAFLAGAIVLTGVFLFKYKVDPLTGRAGGGASVTTRDELYRDTFALVRNNPIYALLGYGTEQPRTESGTTKEGTRYVPPAGTHSTYLNYLFRTGVPGALMILALYVTAGLHARAAARGREGDERMFATLATAAVVIAAAHAVILSLYVEPIYTLVISLVLGVAMAGSWQLPRSVWPWRRGPSSA